MSIRPFGTDVADLDLRFAASRRNELVTRLLAQCGAAPAPELAQWSLARRGQALLALRLAPEPDARLAAQCRCGACGQAYELELALADLVSAPPDGPVRATGPQGQQLLLRLPCAADLQAWGQAPGGDTTTVASTAASTVASTMATSLLLQVDGQPVPPGFAPPADWQAPMAQALDQADPLTALSADTQCPHCGHTQVTALDVEALLLHELAHTQRALQQQVLRLAQALHWSEAQILALPAWRRAWYLDQLDA